VADLSLLISFLINLATWICLFGIISMSLNLEYGYAGIPNFGKLLAVAGGAYFVGGVSGRILAILFNRPAGVQYIDNNLQLVADLNAILGASPAASLGFLILSIGGAALFGAFLGYVASYPAIRLRGDYLAIILLAMGEILLVVGDNWTPLIGGSLGVRIPDPLRWIGSQYRPPAVLLVTSLLTVLVFLYLEQVSRSPLGRLLRAIRENEVCVSVYGRDVVRLRTRTLMVGFAIASISGALSSLWTISVTAKDFDRIRHTFIPWIMVIVGGAGNNLGALVGSAIFIILREIIIFYKYSLEAFIPFDVVWLENMFLGLALILVLMYRPQGLIPEKPTKTLSVEKLREMSSSAGGVEEAGR